MVKGIVIPAAGEEPLEVRDFHQLEDCQGAVGGWIEAVDIAALGVTLYVNEEGVLRRLPFNSRASMLWWYHVPASRQGAVLVGDAVVVGWPDKHGNSTDLAEDIHGLLIDAEPRAVVIELAAEPRGAERASLLATGRGRWYLRRPPYPDYFAALAGAISLYESESGASRTEVRRVSDLSFALRRHLDS